MNSNVHNFNELRPRIVVMGVGGAGGNAVNNMIASGLQGVEFVSANTDAQALSMSGADTRLQLGVNLTEGLGAGSNPEIGEGAAEEVMEEMKALLSEAHMVFIACGMGGGTGTGAAPVIARIAQELGVLTVAVVTKPFQFEGQRRMRIAEAGIEQLRKYVDTMIVIPNQNLFRLANEQTTFADSFCLADSVLNSGVACVTDLIMKEGLINLDFADVKTVITEMGAAVMGTGVAHGEGRAKKAAEEAISNPLIDDISLKGAKGLLISISGGNDMTLFEVDEVASRIRQEVDVNANIIVGATFDDQLEGYLRVSLVASGLNRGHPEAMHVEADRRRMEQDAQQEQTSLGLSDRLQNMDQAAGVAPRFGRRQNAGAVQGGVAQNPIHSGGQGQRGDVPIQGVDVASGGNGNVKIVNKPPRFMSAEDHFVPPPPSLDGGATGREFVPGAPQSVSQSGVVTGPMRRMPRLEDLPITGQNQLRAYKAPETSHGIVAQKKKVGFFSRLTGRNKRAEVESPDYSEQHEAMRPEHQQVEGEFGAVPPANPVMPAHSVVVEPPLIEPGPRRGTEDVPYGKQPVYRQGVASGRDPSSRMPIQEAPVGAPVSGELPLGEYDKGMEDHYKMHPSQSVQVPDVENGNEWVPARPETPAERYPTMEINKGLPLGGALDDEEAIADIPPFLKKKRDG